MSADDHVVAYVKWLEGRVGNIYSQFGEDGFVDAALEHIGETNRWCFEVGANDGRYFSNTLRLREQGWSAILIEAEAVHYEKLKEFRSDKVWTVHEKIDSESLDRILLDCGCPQDLDFGVIDVDGQDYWIWDGLTRFAPRLILIEFEPDELGSTRDSNYIPPVGGSGQAKLSPIMMLAEAKGYEPLAKTYVNALFARKDCLRV
jgi:hypothetical protein